MASNTPANNADISIPAGKSNLLHPPNLPPSTANGGNLVSPGVRRVWWPAHETDCFAGIFSKCLYKILHILSDPYEGTVYVCRGGRPPTCTQILERRLNLSRS